MAKFKSFRIQTDEQIARALLKPGTSTRREMMARANLAGEHYRQLARKSVASRGYDSPSHPFEQKDQLSITDKAAWKKPRVEGGKLILEVRAPAAEFAETGNEGVEADKKMVLRVKSSAVRKSRGKRGGKVYKLSGGARVKKEGSKYLLFTKKVAPARARRFLEKAVRSAFSSRR